MKNRFPSTKAKLYHNKEQKAKVKVYKGTFKFNGKGFRLGPAVE